MCESCTGEWCMGGIITSSALLVKPMHRSCALLMAQRPSAADRSLPGEFQTALIHHLAYLKHVVPVCGQACCWQFPDPALALPCCLETCSCIPTTVMLMGQIALGSTVPSLIHDVRMMALIWSMDSNLLVLSCHSSRASRLPCNTVPIGPVVSGWPIQV